MLKYNINILFIVLPYIILIISFIGFVLYNLQLKKRHYKLFRFLHHYLNTITSARYGNLNSKIDDGIDTVTKQLSKNTNALFESIADRDNMIQEYIQKEKARN